MIDKRGRHRGERLPAVRLQKFGTPCSRQPHYADKISDRDLARYYCAIQICILYIPYGLAGTAGETLERSSCPGGGGRTGCRTGYQDLVALRSPRLRRGIIIIIVGTFHRDDKPPHSKNDSASVYSSISLFISCIQYLIYDAELWFSMGACARQRIRIGKVISTQVLEMSGDLRPKSVRVN